MSPSPVSARSRLTVTRWCRCRLCSQPRCVPSRAVFPAALFGDGLEDLGSSAPAFLGCLREIAVGEFLSGLRQEMRAGLLILLGGHLGLLLLFLEVSNCGLPWQ